MIVVGIRIEPTATIEKVVSAAAVECVTADAAAEDVVAEIEVEAPAAIELVVPLIPIEGVIADSPEEGIITEPADQRVVTGLPVKLVVAARADGWKGKVRCEVTDHVVSKAAVNDVIPGAGMNGVIEKRR